MVGQLCTTLSLAHKQQYMCSKHYYIYCKSIAWLASGHFSHRHPSQSESPTTASFFIAMYLKKKMKNKTRPRQRQMLGHFSQRHPLPSESHFILQQLHPSIILYRGASEGKSKTPETKTNCLVSGQWIFSTNVIRYIWALLVTTLLPTCIKQRIKTQDKKNTFQTWINKNHLMPYEPLWPPLCGPTTAYLHHSL